MGLDCISCVKSINLSRERSYAIQSKLGALERKGRKRGRKGAADVRSLTCVYFFKQCYNCEKGTGKSVRKEQK